MAKGRTIATWMLPAISVCLALGYAGWWWLGRPMYSPGDARRQVESNPLPAAGQASGSASPPGAAALPAAGGFWTVAPGLRLYHFESGRGEDVLFVHGGPGLPHREPLPGLKPLEDRYRFHYYDQRGCGLSTRPFERFEGGTFHANLRALESTLGLSAQVGDIERIRRILGEDRIVLVGHSFGAFLAALYAAEFPDHVRGLVLVAPAAVLVLPSADGGLYEEIERNLAPERLPAYREFVRESFAFGRLFERDEEALVALHARIVPFYREAARARGFEVPVAPAAEGGGFMVEAQYMSMGRRHDYRPALAAVNAPTLVVHGDRDLQSLESSALYRESVPGARLERFARSGHFAFFDEPDRFARVVGEFLDRLPPDRRLSARGRAGEEGPLAGRGGSPRPSSRCRSSSRRAAAR